MCIRDSFCPTQRVKLILWKFFKSFFGSSVKVGAASLGTPWEYFEKELANADNTCLLYTSHRVGICEDDIRAYYRRERITTELIHSLDKALHNKWIEYDLSLIHIW